MELHFRPTLSDPELSLVAWAETKLGKTAACSIRQFLIKETPKLEGLGITAEHQLRQEAQRRGVSLIR